MRLHSVDEDTGHVLVHYLCTGTYQTLDNTDASTANNGRVEFKRAVLAYFTAMTYELHGLQQLAMENVEHWGKEMTTLDIFDLVDQEFPDFLDKTGWLNDYLKKKVKATFEDECTSFTKGAILDRIGNVELIKMLAKCIVELYTTMVTDKTDCIQTVSEEIVCGVNTGPSGEALVEETFAEELLVNDVLTEEVYDTPVAKPTTGDCVAEELVTAGSKIENEPETEPLPQPAPTEKLESFLASFTATTATIKKKKSKKAAIAETKKKSKVEEPPPLPPAGPESEPLPPPALIDGWDSFAALAATVKTKKNKKDVLAERRKRKEAAKEGSPVEQLPGAAAAVIPVKKGKKGKKTSTVAAIPDPPEEEPLPEVAIPEPVVETKLDDSWASFESPITNTTQKSEKGKKGVVEEPPPSPPPPGPNEFVDTPAEMLAAEDIELVLQTDYLDCPASPISDFMYLEF
jgi:hypothetical protein